MYLKVFSVLILRQLYNLLLKVKKSIGIELTEDFRTFLCFLYTEGIAGMIINTAQHPKNCSKEKLLEYFSITISSVIKAFNEKKNH